jgi:hypothetical protein
MLSSFFLLGDLSLLRTAYERFGRYLALVVGVFGMIATGQVTYRLKAVLAIALIGQSILQIAFVGQSKK